MASGEYENNKYFTGCSHMHGNNGYCCSCGKDLADPEWRKAANHREAVDYLRELGCWWVTVHNIPLELADNIAANKRLIDKLKKDGAPVRREFLSAIREPTIAQIDAAYSLAGGMAVGPMWRAMVDALLRDTR